MFWAQLLAMYQHFFYSVLFTWVSVQEQSQRAKQPVHGLDNSSEAKRPTLKSQFLPI